MGESVLDKVAVTIHTSLILSQPSVMKIFTWVLGAKFLCLNMEFIFFWKNSHRVCCTQIKDAYIWEKKMNWNFWFFFPAACAKIDFLIMKSCIHPTSGTLISEILIVDEPQIFWNFAFNLNNTKRRWIFIIVCNDVAVSPPQKKFFSQKVKARFCCKASSGCQWLCLHLRM